MEEKDIKFNKCRQLEGSVLIDTRSPINTGSLLNSGVSRSEF